MIDIRDYDLAVTERIKSYFNNTHFIMRPTIPIKEIRDRKLLDGKDIEFPLITVRRTNCPIFSKEYNSWSRANYGMSYYTGKSDPGYRSLVDYDPELAESILQTGQKDAVSVVNSTFDLTYYIDVISFERDNFDTLMVEVQENLFRIPFIGFYNIKPDGTIDKLVPNQACHLTVEEVEDVSDIDNFDSGNSLYRATITIKLNAYIYRKYKSKTVDRFNIAFNIVPKWLSDIGVSSILEYLQSEYALAKLRAAGYSDLNDFLHSLGYSSLEDFITAFNQGKETSIIFDLGIGPDGVILIFKIPSREDGD